MYFLVVKQSKNVQLDTFGGDKQTILQELRIKREGWNSTCEGFCGK